MSNDRFNQIQTDVEQKDSKADKCNKCAYLKNEISTLHDKIKKLEAALQLQEFDNNTLKKIVKHQYVEERKNVKADSFEFSQQTKGQ